MIVFHTLYIQVSNPDIHHSRDFLDFGKGFYVTTNKQQAINYANRFIRRNGEAWLNVYELNDGLSNWNILFFEEYNETWLDYVYNCRKGVKEESHYDIIIGGVANDKVFRTIDLFFSGEITKQEALKRLIYEKPNIQYCLRNQQLIDAELHYISSERL